MNVLSAASLLEKGPTTKTISQRQRLLELKEEIMVAAHGHNSTMTTLAQRMGCGVDRISGVVRELVKERKLLVWRIGSTRWYSVNVERLK